VVDLINARQLIRNDGPGCLAGRTSLAGVAGRDAADSPGAGFL